MVGRVGPGYPIEGSIAHRIIALVNSSGPLTIDEIGKRLILLKSKVIKPISLLVLGEWLIPEEADPVTYRVTEKSVDLLSRPKDVWNDKEHQQWMAHYREKAIERTRRNFLNRG